jgi:hypothetical protein
MRAELRFSNGPFVWLAYLAYIAIYSAGFGGALLQNRIPVQLPAGSVPLVLAGLTLLSSAYSMAFLEPKDPVRLRWLGEQFAARRLKTVFLALDCWMLSYAATLAVGLLLTLLWLGTVPLLSLAAVAVLGFLTRDIGIFLLGRLKAGAKGDFAALAILAALYLVLPTLLARAHLAFLLVPSGREAAGLTAMAAWAQGIAVALLALHSMKKGFTRS